MKKFISTSLAFLCIMTSSASFPNKLSAIENKSNIKFYLKSASSILCTILPAFIANAIFKPRSELQTSIIPEKKEAERKQREEEARKQQEEEARKKQEEARKQREEREKEKEEEINKEEEIEQLKKAVREIKHSQYLIHEKIKSKEIETSRKTSRIKNELKELKTQSLKTQELGIKIGELDSNQKDLDTEIKNLDTEIKNLDTEIKNLDTEIEDLDTEIKDLKNKINNIKKVSIETINSLIDNIETLINDAHTLYTKALSESKTDNPEYFAKAFYANSLRDKSSSLNQYAKDINIVQLNEKDFITYDLQTSYFENCSDQNLSSPKKIFNKQGYEYCKNEKLLNKFLDYNYSDVHRLMYLYEENKDFNKDDFLNKAFLYVCKKISSDSSISSEIKCIKLDPKKLTVKEFSKTIYTYNGKFYRVLGYAVFQSIRYSSKIKVQYVSPPEATQYFKTTSWVEYWNKIASCFDKSDTYHAVILLTPCNMDSFTK